MDVGFQRNLGPSHISKGVADQKPQPLQGTLLHVSLIFSSVTEKLITALCHLRGKLTKVGNSV